MTDTVIEVYVPHPRAIKVECLVQSFFVLGTQLRARSPDLVVPLRDTLLDTSRLLPTATLFWSSPVQFFAASPARLGALP